MKDIKKPSLVFGGTGHFGQKIVEHMINKNIPVRILTRNRERALEMFPEHVEVIEGNVCSREDILASLKNASDVVISLSAVNPKQIRHLDEIEGDAVIAIIEEMEKSEVKRLVYLSVYDIREPLLDQLKIQRLAKVKIRVEKRIKKSTLNWTILGCPPSYELFFKLLKKNKLIVPGGGRHKIACVSREDIGEIAAQVISGNLCGHQRIRICGPEALSFPDVANRISIFTNQEIKVVGIPLCILNVVSRIAKPLFPFLRFMYYGVKMMNHFPEDLASQVPHDHNRLLKYFDYSPVSIDQEIERRLYKG